MKIIFAISLGLVFFSPILSIASTKVLNKKEVQGLVTCAAPLVSKWVQEIGYAKEIKTNYGDMEFKRTDVGSPDGRLTVQKGNKVLCDIELSLSPEIYFSGRDQLMLIYSYSGSNTWWSIYSLKDSKCTSLGLTKDNEAYLEVKKLLDPSDGNRTCK